MNWTFIEKLLWSPLSQITYSVIACAIFLRIQKLWDNFAKKRSESRREYLNRQIETAKLLKPHPDLTSAHIVREIFDAVTGIGIVICVFVGVIYIQDMGVGKVAIGIVKMIAGWVAGAGAGRFIGSVIIGGRYSQIFTNNDKYIEKIQKKIDKI